MAVNGSTILLYKGAAALGSQRDVTIDRTDNLIDVSVKGDYDRKYIPGQRTVTINCDMLYVAGESGQAALESLYESNGESSYQLVEGASARHNGTARITSLSISAPVNDVAVAQVTLQSDGDSFD